LARFDRRVPAGSVAADEHGEVVELENPTDARGSFGSCRRAVEVVVGAGVEVVEPSVLGLSAVVDVAGAARPRPGFSTEAVQEPARVNVTCVTPLGEEVASTS
jgi:hypothetical protein